MLKVLPPLADNAQNLKIGEVYFPDTNNYYVQCCLCNEQIEFEQFQKHFQAQHFQQHFYVVSQVQVKNENASTNAEDIKNEAAQQQEPKDEELIDLAEVKDELAEYDAIAIDAAPQSKSSAIKTKKQRRKIAKLENNAKIAKPEADDVTAALDDDDFDRASLSSAFSNGNQHDNNANDEIDEDYKPQIKSSAVKTRKQRRKLTELENNPKIAKREADDVTAALDDDFDRASLSSAFSNGNQHDDNANDEDYKPQIKSSAMKTRKQRRKLTELENNAKIAKPEADEVTAALADNDFDRASLSSVHSNGSQHDAKEDEDDNDDKDYKPTLLPCMQCDRFYETEKSLKKHIYKCHNTKKVAKSSQSETKKSKSGKFKCDECGLSLRSQANLVNHKYVHTGIFCEICSKVYKSIYSLRLHLATHKSEGKQFKCPQCDKLFLYKSAMANHLRRHSNNPTLMCELCGKLVYSPTHLRQHMLRHSGERPVKCPVCAKGFFNVTDLKIHSTVHTDARPFKCETCNATFQQKRWLVHHQKRHNTKPLSYVCEMCEKGFFQAKALIAHVRTHDAAKHNVIIK